MTTYSGIRVSWKQLLKNQGIPIFLDAVCCWQAFFYMENHFYTLKWLHFGQNHPSILQNPWLERAASWSNWQLEPTPCYFHLIRSQDTLLWYGSQDAPGHHLLGSWISLQDHVLPVSKPHGPKIFWYLIVLCKKSWESQLLNLKNISI